MALATEGGLAVCESDLCRHMAAVAVYVFMPTLAIKLVAIVVVFQQMQ